jgi:hypothetical protein
MPRPAPGEAWSIGRYRRLETIRVFETVLVLATRTSGDEDDREDIVSVLCAGQCCIEYVWQFSFVRRLAAGAHGAR